VRLGRAGFVGDPDVAAVDGLHSRRACRLVELTIPNTLARSVIARPACRPRRPARGFVDGTIPSVMEKLAVEAKVDEGGIRHRLAGNGRGENFTTRSLAHDANLTAIENSVACFAFQRETVHREKFMTRSKD